MNVTISGAGARTGVEWRDGDVAGGIAVNGPRLARRAVLKGAIAAALAAVVAACGRAAPTPSASAEEPAFSPPPSTAAPASPGGSLAAPPTVAPASPGRTPATPSLEQRIAGLLVVGFRGSSLGDAPWVAAALRDGLGGVILFDRDQRTGKTRNILSSDQVRRITGELREAAGRAPVIAVDQEGGVVTRLSPAHGFPAVASEAEIGTGTDAAARRWATSLAATLARAEITLNLAPVVDLDVNPRSPAIGALGRSFSADPAVVVAKAGIEVAAHREAGVATALKHFPGIGSSTGNTDNGIVDASRTWTTRELEPFRRLVESDRADLVMVGHVRVDRLDPDRPASLSHAVVTDLLRGTIGWEGIVITDDLQAAAIAAHGSGKAAVLALEAGADLLLFANQQVYDDAIVDTVVAAVAGAVSSGRLDERAIDTSRNRVQALFPSA